MTRLILNRVHTHARRQYAPGDALDADAPTAEWLIAQGVARPEPEPVSVETDPEHEPKTKPRSAALQRQEPQP